MKTRLIPVIAALFIGYSPIIAQDTLSLNAAIGIAIENNYRIIIAGSEVEIAKISNTPGNAGMLPQLNLKGSGNWEYGNVYQRFSDGSENNFPSFSGSTVNAASELNWTIFDGGRMFATKHRLESNQDLAELSLQEEKNKIRYDVTAAYFDVVRNYEILHSLNKILEIAQQRFELSEKAFNTGMLQKSDLLQASIDLNAVQKSMIEQEYLIKQSEEKLRVLLCLPSVEFVLSDSLKTEYLPDFETLSQSLIAANTELMILQKQTEVASFSLKESRRNIYPKIGLNAGYYLLRTVNSEGTIIENYSIGPQIGGSIVIPIFQSGEYRRKIATDKINLASAEYQYRYYHDLIGSELKVQYLEFVRLEKLIELEKDNNLLMSENIAISLHRLELGEAASTEIHQAQQQYLESCTNLINYRYNLKLSEARIQLLSGENIR
ncbi:MAG: TolC family protein [Bacteroidales bacterium]|nr:TolC family protein [Bacteroidales bacterium]HOY39123.1 TolC family protein [Bacteroidales bacterium]HQP03234.1 TolC family protein [Bacteroidales bacterium]